MNDTQKYATGGPIPPHEQRHDWALIGMTDCPIIPAISEDAQKRIRQALGIPEPTPTEPDPARLAARYAHGYQED